jgi:predicted amidohydrolase YtcJ
MVDRRSSTGSVIGPDKAVSVDAALRAFTIDGARAVSRERVLGSISPGKWADLVVLDEDPHKVWPERIADIEVLATYVAGAVAFARDIGCGNGRSLARRG